MNFKKLADEAKTLWEMSSAVAQNTPPELTVFDRAKIKAEVMYRIIRTATIRQNIIRRKFELKTHARALEAKGVSFEEEESELDGCKTCPMKDDYHEQCFENPIAQDSFSPISFMNNEN